MTSTEIALAVLEVVTLVVAGIIIYRVRLAAGTNIIVDCNSINETIPASLDKKFARSLVKNYNEGHLVCINNDAARKSNGNTEFESDSRSIWFSLNNLKKFICQIETNSASNFGLLSEQLGVRIYYGEYPTSDNAMWNRFGDIVPEGIPALPNGSLPQISDIRSIYGGKHTLLMVPTYRTGAPLASNMDFDPTKIATQTAASGGANTPMSMTEIFSTDGILSVMMLNHGGMVPPPSGANLEAIGATLISYSDSAGPLIP